LKLLQQQDKDNTEKIDSPVAANATADLATPATQSNTTYIGCINNANQQM
jgi:hypothetical protein